ncbi:MAG: triose-phosphate isomerase [Planctomycetota bacterium]|nr:MAG: triose-phosphate isomerase [Planctomycetota bacterium]
MARKTLITARDLERRPALPLPADALLTPLARDLLRKRGLWPPPVRAGGRGCGAPRLVVANWKSHKTIPEALAFARGLREELASRRPRAGAVVCPPATALANLRGPLRGVAELGAQDVSAHDEGAHTGELAARHLVDAGARYVLVGHSERRAAGEDDARCRAKVRAALRGGLTPILCVGETAGERDAGRTEHVVAGQLEAVFAGLDLARATRVVLAYEPRWAIGTGRVPQGEDVAAVLAHARAVLARAFPPDAVERVPVLYGGSVNERNAARLLALPGCSGALVGGASLDPARFAQILASA